jgi:tetratricopeptide (TPR) repeat protein
MLKSFSPTPAGPILNRLIDAFDLRHWDSRGVLSQKNQRRYLAGERVSSEAEHLVFRAVADALIASMLWPDLARFTLPSRPDGKDNALPTAEVLARLIGTYAAQWDQFVGTLRNYSPSTTMTSDAAFAFLRIEAIDASLRLGALLWLLDGPSGRIRTPEWASPKSASRYLRTLQERCSSGRPSRDDITTGLDVNFKTVDEWLDGGSRPAEIHIEKLAAFLGSRGAGEPDDIAREIRVHFSLEALFEELVHVVGEADAAVIADRFVGYTNEAVAFVAGSRQSRQMNDGKMLINLCMGTLSGVNAPWNEHLLRHIWRMELDPVWRTDLRASYSSSFSRLQQVLARLVPPLDVELLAVFGREPTDEEVRELRYLTLADPEEVLGIEPAARRDRTLLNFIEDHQLRSLVLACWAREADSRNDYVTSAAFTREAVRLNPSQPYLHFAFGCALWQTGDADAGIVELEIAAQMQPSWDRPHAEVGIVLCNLERYDAAVARLEAGLTQVTVPSWWLTMILARAHELGGNAAEAIKHYEQVMVLKPDQGEVLDRLAHLYFTAGDKVAGADRCKRANALGFSAVHHAWRSGYYADDGKKPRPPQTLPLDRVVFTDLPWPCARKRS